MIGIDAHQIHDLSRAHLVFGFVRKAHRFHVDQIHHGRLQIDGDAKRFDAVERDGDVVQKRGANEADDQQNAVPFLFVRIADELDHERQQHWTEKGDEIVDQLQEVGHQNLAAVRSVSDLQRVPGAVLHRFAGLSVSPIHILHLLDELPVESFAYGLHPHVVLQLPKCR